jgi:hypothetical protein
MRSFPTHPHATPIEPGAKQSPGSPPPRASRSRPSSIREVIALRAQGNALRTIADAVTAKGHKLSHEGRRPESRWRISAKIICGRPPYAPHERAGHMTAPDQAAKSFSTPLQVAAGPDGVRRLGPYQDCALRCALIFSGLPNPRLDRFAITSSSPSQFCGTDGLCRPPAR